MRYREWLEEWPYSEQARALSWLEPKRRRAYQIDRALHLRSSGPKFNGRRFKKRYEKKGRFSGRRGMRSTVQALHEEKR